MKRVGVLSIRYCPMHCEDEKTYPEPGDCPVCGMDLLEQPSLTITDTQYTCPMHPEVVKDEAGDCPICGMDLVPMAPTESNEQKAYQELVHKMKVATLFTVPVFLIAMADLIPGKPLLNMMSQQSWNGLMFFLTLPGFTRNKSPSLISWIEITRSSPFSTITASEGASFSNSLSAPLVWLCALASNS